MNDTVLYPLKLMPLPCAKIWGGTRLSAYGKPLPENGDGIPQEIPSKLGESIELTLGACGESVIANGKHAGSGLGKYLSLIGQNIDELPVVVKLIDAEKPLSVQVHPRKTELWYVIESEPDAEIIYGLEDNFDREQFEAALKDGDPGALLHREKIRAGEFYMLPSGLIHALGGGVLVAEFQQNDAETQRLYDYGRDRELHVSAALDTVERLGISKKGDGIAVMGISECEFFSVKKIDITESAVISAEDMPLFFICVDCDGDCTAAGDRLCRGDSYFLPRGCTAQLRGKNITLLTMTW